VNAALCVSILRGSLREHLRRRLFIYYDLILRCPAKPGLEGC
jgi:hypothetical protein